MKIIYVSDGCYTSENKLKGTEKKVLCQIKALNNLGVEVIHLHPHNICNQHFLNYLIIKILGPINNILIRKKISSDTIVYIRREFHHVSYMPLLIEPKKYRVVFETQSIEPIEYTPKKSSPIHVRLFHSYSYLCLCLFEKYIKNHSNAIVSVTKEINSYNQLITNSKLKYLTLGNGIDITTIRARDKQLYSRTIYHILCVAGVSVWHGIDRFIRGMHDYSGDKTIILHIVGDGAELPNLKTLTLNLHLESQVIFHGYKSGANLDAMFDQCHIAIGSLAGFRVNLNELSSLKSREYCARGIPFLMASKDADFPESWEYIQMVPADESPVDMNTVISFAERVMADPEHPQKMRKYAEEHLDWLAKMKILKEFLENL